jgi:putative permease
MRKLLQSFFDRYFHDEEAIIFVILLGVALLILVTMGSILAPLVASVVIAYLLQSLINSLLRYNVGHRLAFFAVYSLFAGFFVAILFFLLPQALGQLGRFINDLPGLIGEGQEVLLQLPDSYPGLVSEQQVQALIGTLRGDLAVLGQRVVSYSISSIPRIFDWLVFLVLVPVLVFFILKDKTLLVQWISNLLPHNRPLMLQVWLEMDMQLANYIRGKVLEILIVGGCIYLAFMVLGVNYTLMLSVLVGLSVVVPFIGVAAAAVPVALVAYVQCGFGNEFIAVMLAYSLIQLLDTNVLVPVIFSETVNLRPVAIISAWPDTIRKHPLEHPH